MFARVVDDDGVACGVSARGLSADLCSCAASAPASCRWRLRIPAALGPCATQGSLRPRAGVPATTSCPPASPPSGPRSIIQSDERITSRLCSMTSSEWPILSSLRNARSSLATSSKCRPVVGSSNRNSLPRIDGVSSAAASARWPASFRRCASPPDSVGTGWPSFTYSRPTSTSGCRRTATLELPRKNASASVTVMSSTCGDVLARAVRAFAADLERLGAITLAVAVRAAQVHVREELHLDVLEAVAAAGGAAARAGVEAERAGRVLARPGHRFVREQLAHDVECADVTRRIRARGAADRALVDHDHVVDLLRAFEAVERARRFAGLALGLAQRLVQHVFDERGFARARHAGDAHQPAQRKLHVDVLEIVLRDAAQLDGASAPAPCARVARWCPGFGGGARGATIFAPDRYCPVSDFGLARTASGVSKATISPPRSPAPGPRSSSRSAASMICGSCSTTTSELPASRSRCITCVTRCMSRGCRPMDGSSSTNSVLTSEVPSAVVRLMRWTSPPESVRDCRSSVR